VDLRRGEVVRQLARDNLEVNDSWACDKGRFAFPFVDAASRMTTPLLRDRGLVPVSFGEVLDQVAAWTRGARVGVLTGGRLSDEDSYALSKLARTVWGTNDLDHRREPMDLAVELAAAASPMTVTYRDVERAPAIVVAGLDAEQEVPILHLRLRKAARRGAKIWVLHPRRTRLHDVATHVLCAPGEEAALLTAMASAGEVALPPELAEAADALRAAGPAGVVLAGERLAGQVGASAAAMDLAAASDARWGLVSRRANDRGALRAGVHPRLLPGGRAVEADADVAQVEAVWGRLASRGPGRDTRGILEACAAREIDVLLLVGIDPLRDVPDAGLAARALQNVPVKIVQGLELGDLESFADAFLPAAPFLEKDAHMTDWEGRGQRLRPVREPQGMSLPDWEIFAAMARACGGDLGFTTLDELHEEMGPLLAPREAPRHEAFPSADIATDAAHGEDAVRLFTYPLLVDEGRLSVGADELKAALGHEAFVEVHPGDAARLGLIDGGRALVRTDAGQAELPVVVTEHIARGSAFVPFNQPGLAANTLLAGSMRTWARLEPIDAQPADGTEPSDAPLAQQATGGDA
jgi:NADH-quinone oxidoreductase subunit G